MLGSSAAMTIRPPFMPVMAELMKQSAATLDVYKRQSMDFENFEAQISLRDKVNREKYIGSDENWEKAERAIIEACEEKGLKAKIEYGEAAFYGPKPVSYTHLDVYKRQAYQLVS